MERYELSDIADPKKYADIDKMDELFARLRKEDPVPLVITNEYRPFWAITKFEDNVKIESQPELFISEPLTRLVPKVIEEGMLKKYGRTTLTRFLANIDPPEYEKWRSIFIYNNPRYCSMEKNKKTMQEIAKELVDGMANYQGEYGECNFVWAISIPYTMRVANAFVGVPQEDWKFLYDIGLRLWTLGNYVKEGKFDSSIPETAFEEINQYWSKLFQDRRANPKDDYATQIANATIDGKLIPDFEGFSALTRTTTRAFDNAEIIITSCIVKLIQSPEFISLLKNDKKLIIPFVEEINRWVCPSLRATRTATIDYELRGKKIKAGDLVMLCWNSANKDEDVVADPFTFRIDRVPNKHLSFGSGPHACPGKPIAILLISVMLEELLSRLDHLQLSKDLSYTIPDFKVHLNELIIKYKLKK